MCNLGQKIPKLAFPNPRQTHSKVLLTTMIHKHGKNKGFNEYFQSKNMYRHRHFIRDLLDFPPHRQQQQQQQQQPSL